jgi:hypothetical protein
MLNPNLILHNFGDLGPLDMISQMNVSKPTEIWVNTFKNFPGLPHTQKIFIAVEPDAVSGFNKKLKQHAKAFTHILTFEEELLSLPNAVLFEFGSSWIDPSYSFPEKSFGVSMICGFKHQTEGHRLRHKLWDLQQTLTIPRHFYVSSVNPPFFSWFKARQWKKTNPVLGSSKAVLFDTQFHLAIENCRSPYYFSEKLIDCFVTKTVPVYWGAQKISSYFNPKGIITIKDEKDAIRVLNTLTPSTYDGMVPYIEENFIKAQPFRDYPQRLHSIIERLSL